MKHLYGHRWFGFWGSVVNEGDFALPKDENWRLGQIRTIEDLIFKTTSIRSEQFCRAELEHGTNIYQVTSLTGKMISPGTDGLMTSIPSSTLVVSGADCPPVLIVDRKHRALGLAHSGKKGTEGQIAVRLIENMCRSYGSLPKDLDVYIGPGICGRHFELPVVDTAEFRHQYQDVCLVRGDKAYLDLRQVIRIQLIKAGVLSSAIHASPECTYEEAHWHSSRRDRYGTGALPKDARPRVSIFAAVLY